MAKLVREPVSRRLGKSMTITTRSRFRSGDRWWGAIVLLMGLTLLPSVAQAQSRPALPDENTINRLVWATMIALDNANRTNDYSVLHALGSTEFQVRNSPDRLQAEFAGLRQNRVDIGRSVMISPNFYRAPKIDENGHLRLRGGFDYRPKSVRFDLIYILKSGGWQIAAMSVVEMDSNAAKN